MSPWIEAWQSMRFSRQEYLNGLPFPSPGGHPDPGIEPGSPALQTDSLPSEPTILLREQRIKVTLFPSSYNQGQEENSITTVLFILKKLISKSVKSIKNRASSPNLNV